MNFVYNKRQSQHLTQFAINNTTLISLYIDDYCTWIVQLGELFMFFARLLETNEPITNIPKHLGFNCYEEFRVLEREQHLSVEEK